MLKHTLKEDFTEGYRIRILGFVFSIFLFLLFDFVFGAGFRYYHYLIFILICAAGILLSPFYYIFKSYDKILHFSSPFLLCFIVFFVINNLQEDMRIKLFLTFTVTVMCITIMEIGEYVIDKMLGWGLQGVYVRNRSGILKLEVIQDKIDDAMQDLIFGILGCLFFVLLKIIF